MPQWLRTHALLLGITALGLALRLWRLDFRSIWLDEAYSLTLAQGSWAGIIQGAAMDIHPPLYHLLLAGWIRWFGTSEFAARSLSALAGAALVPVAYAWVRRLGGKPAAVATALLVAISPYFVEISRMARMPALFALAVGLSLLLFWRWLETGNWRWGLGYWAATLAALYTHYFAALLVMVQILYLFLGIQRLKLPLATRRAWLWLQFLLLAGFAPWLPEAWQDWVQGGPSWRGSGSAWLEPAHMLYQFLLGTACWSWTDKALALGGIGAGLAVAAAYWFRRGREAVSLLAPRVWGFLAILIAAPLALVYLYSRFQINVFDVRYLSLSALGLWVLVGVFVAALPTPWRWFSILLVAAGCWVPLHNQYWVYGYYDNWRSVAADISQQRSPEERVAVFPAWNRTPLLYYMKKPVKIAGIPGDYDPISGRTENYFYVDPQSAHQLQSRFPDPRLWLVLVNAGESQSAVLEWFEGQYRVDRRQVAGSITILHGTR